MFVSQGRHSGIGRPSVSMNYRTWHHHRLYERQQTVGRYVFHHGHAYSPGTSATFFCGYNNNRFFLYLSARQRFFRTANIHFINLNCPAKAIAPVPNHCTAQLMEPSPGCLIASKSKNSLQPKSIGSLFLACNKPHRKKPSLQWLASAFKNCSSYHRGLPLTSTAMKETTRSSPRLSTPKTVRADESIRPPETLKILSTRTLAWKPSLKLLECARIVYASDRVSRILHSRILHAGTTGVKWIPRSLEYSLAHSSI